MLGFHCVFQLMRSRYNRLQASICKTKMNTSVCSDFYYSVPAALAVIQTAEDKSPECRLSKETRTLQVLHKVQEQLSVDFGSVCFRLFFTGLVRGLRKFLQMAPELFSELYIKFILTRCSYLLLLTWRRKTACSFHVYSTETMTQTRWTGQEQRMISHSDVIPGRIHSQ